jgi:quercetin dioxygenase-like cupin family protein
LVLFLAMAKGHSSIIDSLDRRSAMKLRILLQSTAIIACTTVSGLALSGTTFADSDPAGTVTPAFSEMIPTVPGKSLIAVIVTYPPGGKTPPHHHAHSAFVTGYVLSGAIRSQVDDGQVRVYHAGESFTEKPGASHRVSENASTTEPAKLLAVFVVDTNDTKLTTLDGQ